MAYADLVHQTTTSTGTGALTLASINGRRTFLDGFGTGGTNVFAYFVSHRGAAEWERGTGHEASGTLVRDTVIASSNANAAVNFSAGTKDCTHDQPANERFNKSGTETLDGTFTFTSTNGLLISNTAPILQLNRTAAGAGQSFVRGEVAGVGRWDIYLGNSQAEGGSNAGSNFELIARDDAGAGLGTALFGTRSTALLTVKADPTALLGIATKQYADLKVAKTGENAVTGNLLLTSTTGVLGYTTGSGSAVTQLTNRTTGVTLSRPTGAITLVSAAGSATFASFTVTNTVVTAVDTVVVCQKSGTDLYEIHVTAVAAGSFRISFRTTGGTTTEQPVFNFAVIRGAAS